MIRNHVHRAAGTILLAAFSGCCLGPRTVDTVPWWKGLPCMVIAPSSLEAMAWRDHLYAQRQAACAPRWAYPPPHGYGDDCGCAPAGLPPVMAPMPAEPVPASSGAGREPEIVDWPAPAPAKEPAPAEQPAPAKQPVPAFRPPPLEEPVPGVEPVPAEASPRAAERPAAGDAPPELPELPELPDLSELPEL